MKTFKHKQSGILAEQINSNLYRENRRQREIPKMIIESGTDREEIKEEDWIEKAFLDYVEFPDEKWRIEFREAINKYLPRITDDMIEKISDIIYNGISSKENIKFIIKQNLPKDLLYNPE